MDGAETADFKRGRAAEIPVWKYIVKYAAIFAAMIVLWRAKTGGIAPFATGFYLALAFSGQGAVMLMPLYVLSAFIVNPEFSSVISAVITSVSVTAVDVICRKIKKRCPFWLQLIAGAVGQTGFVVFAATGGESVLFALLDLVFSLIFAYVASCAIKPLTRKTAGSPPDTELASACITAAVLFAGFASMTVYKIQVAYVLGIFACGACGYVFGRSGAFAAAVCVGVGVALYSFDVGALALFSFVVAVFVMFSGAPRVLSVLSAVMGTVVFELYFAVDSGNLLWDALAVGLGGALYAAVPKSVLDKIKNRFSGKCDKLAVRCLINGGRAKSGEEMKKLGNIFADMSAALRGTVVPVGYGAEDIAAAIKSGICDRCERRGNGCEEEECDEEILRMCESGLASGCASVADMPYLIENDCPSAARLLSVVGEYAAAARRNMAAKGKDNKLREDLAAQLDGVREILSNRARLSSLPVSYDLGAEQRIIEELSYMGVDAGEVLVSRGDADRITLIVRSDDADTDLIARVAGKVENSSFKAVESTSAAAGYSVVELVERTAYDAVFAAANCSKSKAATGDTHSFIRIGDTKFMMALCDGMGFGREAERVSETAVELVESFYRAGFDSDFILKNVNRFLSYEEGESFVAFDILVCDLNTLEMNIIKLGSPAAYIKGEGVAEISGSALPLGSLSEVTPSVYADRVKDGQTVVFTSDGVADVFEGDSLAKFINSRPADNVKLLCEEILERAKQLSGKAVADDMTVTAVKVVKRL